MKRAARLSFPRGLLASAGALTILLLAPGAVAQNQPTPNPAPNPADPTALTPPVPTPPNKLTTNYYALIEAFFLGALIVGVNFIPSKRGHQD